MQYKKAVITGSVGFTLLPVWIIPNNPLGRHSGEGRNPAIKNTPHSGQNRDVVTLARGLVNHLNTGLRRYDANWIIWVMHGNEGTHE